MDLIFNAEHAELLKTKYTVLELETIHHPGLQDPVRAWCVVPADRILGEVQFLPVNIDQHNQLIQAIADNNISQAQTLCQELRGKFGGELDSFYEEIEKRIAATGSCEFVPALNT